jgi:hypothetical protein
MRLASQNKVKCKCASISATHRAYLGRRSATGAAKVSVVFAEPAIGLTGPSVVAGNAELLARRPAAGAIPAAMKASTHTPKITIRQSVTGKFFWCFQYCI